MDLILSSADLAEPFPEIVTNAMRFSLGEVSRSTWVDMYSVVEFRKRDWAKGLGYEVKSAERQNFILGFQSVEERVIQAT